VSNKPKARKKKYPEPKIYLDIRNWTEYQREVERLRKKAKRSKNKQLSRLLA
jgi:hypothetical protein